MKIVHITMLSCMYVVWRMARACALLARQRLSEFHSYSLFLVRFSVNMNFPTPEIRSLTMRAQNGVFMENGCNDFD
jgi:hypothetical protein